MNHGRHKFGGYGNSSSLLQKFSCISITLGKVRNRIRFAYRCASPSLFTAGAKMSLPVYHCSIVAENIEVRQCHNIGNLTLCTRLQKRRHRLRIGTMHHVRTILLQKIHGKTMHGSIIRIDAFIKQPIRCLAIAKLYHFKPFKEEGPIQDISY